MRLKNQKENLETLIYRYINDKKLVNMLVLKLQPILNELDRNNVSNNCKEWFLESYLQYCFNSEKKIQRLSQVSPLSLNECVVKSNLKETHSNNISKVPEANETPRISSISDLVTGWW